MGKRKEWLYQRLKGYKVNGKVATFKPEERIQLGEVLLEMWRELADAVNVKGDGLPNPHIDCIKRLVDAFSFDKGSDNLTEQIAALNNANRILEALRPPSNCTEVEMPSNEY